MPVAVMDETERQASIEGLIRILDDPRASAEAQMAAQERLDFFAREITEWFRPAGYRLLLYIPYLQAKLEGAALVMPDDARSLYQMASIQGIVVAAGQEAYTDQTRFPHGPWCRVGDRVMIRAYSGTRFTRAGYPFVYALINDDTVEAVMRDGLRVERVGR